MTNRARSAACIALSSLLLVPGLAAACPIEFRTIGPVKVQRAELVRPVERTVSRAAWRIDDSWTSTTPELNQVITARSGRTYSNATFARQRALSIDAAAPADNGWRYEDDDDHRTPPCALAGQGEWQPPKILLREDARRIRIAAVTRRTVGDRTGCVLGGEDAEWGCPTLTRTVVKLRRAVGQRQLVFERLV